MDILNDTISSNRDLRLIASDWMIHDLIMWQWQLWMRIQWIIVNVIFINKNSWFKNDLNIDSVLQMILLIGVKTFDINAPAVMLTRVLCKFAIDKGRNLICQPLLISDTIIVGRYTQED